MGSYVGTIMHSEDGGHGWEIKNLYKTQDAGITWDSMYRETDEYLNASCFTDTQHGFVVCSGGKIIRTMDGGKLAQGLNTPTARVKAYTILGNAWSATRIDSGFHFYQEALAVIDSFNLADKRGKILYNLGMLNLTAGNYKKYIILIDSALRFSISVSDFVTISNSFNALGNYYFTTGDIVKARKMYDSAYAVATRKLLYLQMGSALGNLARFEADNKKSTMLQRRAILYMAKCSGSEEPIANCLVNIGYRFPDADSAIQYYDRAINMVSADFAPEVIIGAFNNMAYCYLAKREFNRRHRL